MRVAAVVHAKGKSERLPNKNLRKLGGKPLICHAIKNACDAKLVNDVYIDSEDDIILKVGIACGAKPLKRPQYLANNFITGDDLAYWQAQSLPQYDIIVQVVPTSPFIKPKTIDECIGNVVTGYNSSFTATSEKLYTWSKKHPTESLTPDYYKDGKLLNSKELPYTFVEHTGLYAFKTKYAFENKKRIDPNNFRGVPINYIEAVDINYESDFEIAEVIWKGLHDSKTSTKVDEDLLRAMVRASII